MNTQPSPRRFADAIAARLNDVVPPGLAVRAQGASVDVYGRNTSRHACVGASIIIEKDGRSLAELVTSAAIGILDSTQDAVMEILTEQWPLGENGQVAYPNARIEGERLLMWFGEERAPLIELPSFDITEVLEGAA